MAGGKCVAGDKRVAQDKPVAQGKPVALGKPLSIRHRRCQTKTETIAVCYTTGPES